MATETPCLHCRRVGFVLMESVFSVTRTAVDYHCRLCRHSWSVLQDERREVPRPVLAEANDAPEGCDP